MLIMPVSCPGAGKSYMGQFLVNNDIISDNAIVSPDVVREQLTDNRADQTVNKTVFEIVDSIIDHRIARGLDVYLDATNLNTKLRNKLLRRLERVSYDFSLDIVLLVSELVNDKNKKEIYKRNRERAWPVPDDVFERFWQQAVQFDPAPYVAEYNATCFTFGEVYVNPEIIRSKGWLIC